MGEFSITNTYLNPTGGYTPLPASLSAPGPDDPIWLQLLYGARQIASVLDPYIFTEQERAQMELERLRLQAEREKARQASIQVQPTIPVWVWALVGAGVVVAVFFLFNRE